MERFAFEVVTEGVLSCDGEKCNEDCPIHGTTNKNEQE